MEPDLQWKNTVARMTQKHVKLLCFVLGAYYNPFPGHDRAIWFVSGANSLCLPRIGCEHAESRPELIT